jgi:hypothetical protein
MGHAVPMPVVIKPRTYDTAFYEAIQANAVTPQQSRNSLGSGGKRRI